MAMPWQLREGLKRRVKGAPPRPLVEKLDAINVNDLPVPSQNDEKTYILRNVSLRWPFLAAARICCDGASNFTSRHFIADHPDLCNGFNSRTSGQASASKQGDMDCATHSCVIAAAAS